MFIKYPRTEHLFGSKLLDIGNLSNNLDKQTCLFPELTNSTNHTIIIEEKMDGIGLGIGFFNAQLYIQHRGHTYFIHDPEHQRSIPYFLKEFTIWITQREELLYVLLEERYVLFGEWLLYKHTIFYNSLPSFFMEYDIYDRIDTIFLSTLSREKLLHKYRDNIVSVHVIQKTTKLYLNDLLNILVLSEYSIGKNSSWLNDLSHYCDQKNIPYEYALQKTLCDNLFEGFYIKIETDNYVSGRYKWIRKNFMNIILQNLHWKKYPIIYNQISPLT